MFAVSELLGYHQTSQHLSPVVSKGDSLETIFLPVLVPHEIRTGVTAVKIAELLFMVRPPSYSGMQWSSSNPIHPSAPRRSHPDPKGRASGLLAWSGGKVHPREVLPSTDENPSLVGVERTCPASPRTKILHSASGVHGKKESEQRGSSKARLRLSSANLRSPSVPT